MLRLKKPVALIIAGVFIFNFLLISFPVAPAYAIPPQKLSLEEAVFFAIRNSDEITKVRMELKKKQIEKQEAKEAIKIIRRREKYPWFSLLLTINLPQQHGLPKEIQLIMKIPEIDTAIINLKEQEEYETLVARNKAETAYYDCLLAKYNVQRKEALRKELEEDYNRIRMQYLLGIGSKEDVDYLAKAVEDNNKALQKAVLDLESKIEKLSNIIKIKLPMDIQLEERIPQVNISRSQLNDIISFAEKNDYNLFSFTQKRQIAQTKVVELINIYEGRWGSKVREMTGYVKSQIGRNAERLDVSLDLNRFLKYYYQPALDNIEDPWEGYFSIPMIFFTIKIPKEWFKMGYMAERYFEDQKYALYIALADREQAVKDEKKVREELILSIKTNYSILKQMEIAYEETQNNLAKAREDYERALTQNKLGLVTFKELHSQKMNYYEQEDSAYQMKMDYAKAISLFNLVTSGYLNVTQGGFSTTQLASGDSFIIEEEGSGPQWYVRKTLTDFKFTFGVRIPEEYGVTHFQLFTADHKPIGGRIPVEETLSHLPITFEDNAELYVKLFKEEELLYIATLDGSDISGPLVLERTSGEDKGSKKTVGTWKISKALELYKAQLEIKLTEDMDCNKYGLYYLGTEEQLIGDGLKDLAEPLSHLIATFSDLEKLKIKLYKDDTLVGEGSLERQEEDSGVIIMEN